MESVGHARSFGQREPHKAAFGNVGGNSMGRHRTPADTFAQQRMARIPMKKLCSVEEIAAAVAYLASPQASYITGQTLVLDGGVTSQ